MIGNYKPIIDRRNELLELSKVEGYGMTLVELDCIDHVFECETLNIYEAIALTCKEYRFDTVYDIGCAFGHQSEVFKQQEINYVGINEDKLEFFNRDMFSYFPIRYPMRWHNMGDTSLAISSMCLGWNCYLYEGQKTLIEQMEALSRDFKYAMLNIPTELDLSEWFDVVESANMRETSKLVLLKSKHYYKEVTE